jgi:hypothetical protein
MAGMCATGLLANAQGGDAGRNVAAARQALGGDAKLTAIKSLTAAGHNNRGDVEIAIELPDKFLKKEVFAQVMDTSLARASGFNGAGLIDEMDTPPAMPGLVIRSGGPGANADPAQRDATRARMTIAAKREFARLALGFFASSFSGYPLHLTAAGQADSPDGKADVLDVKSDDGFAARLFVSAQTHLPVMVTWMDKEPVIVTIGGPAGPGRATTVPGPEGGGTFTQMSPEDRKTVEFRLLYRDYEDVDGVKFPFTISRLVDGQPQESLTLEKVRINPKIDPRKFDISK